jgi:nucleoside-diphosphate-sugar epimerase
VRVLILGGTRFVGPHVVGELLGGGHDVALFHRGETESALTARAPHIHGDLADFEHYLPELRSLEPEVVVDLRALRREEGRRVRAFRGIAGRGVVASSVDVYRAFGRLHRTEPGPPDPLPLTEDSPRRELVIWEDYDKLGVEEEAQANPDFPVTVLRLPAIHGPGDYQHRLYRYVKRMDDERPAILLEAGVARWRAARGYVADVAHAIVLAATNEAATGRTYNIADPDAFTEEEWVRQIARVHGWTGQIIAVPTPELPPSLRDKCDLRQDFAVDSSRIRRELGYSERVDHEEALRRTIEWERANPPEALGPAEWDYAAEDAVTARLALRTSD